MANDARAGANLKIRGQAGTPHGASKTTAASASNASMAIAPKAMIQIPGVIGAFNAPPEPATR